MNPSVRRLPQYRADLTAILLVAHELLLSAADGPDNLFRPSWYICKHLHRSSKGHYLWQKCIPLTVIKYFQDKLKI